MFALGLPGFCSYLYIVRVLQSMQRTRVAFYLYLVENGINIALAVVLVHSLGVRGLALSLSVAYSVSALLGVGVLRRWFGHLGTPHTWDRRSGASVWPRWPWASSSSWCPTSRAPPARAALWPRLPWGRIVLAGPATTRPVA
jgi:hypothetical protein